ncbi:hypothetical protein ABT075_25050 [Streptomyces sp. NPDC002677]|uniref:hypothetical protein n=1 Tax=Streptomyces sp. NPDC002677 TaxID=3154774 RepID=UPI00332BB74F
MTVLVTRRHVDHARVTTTGCPAELAALIASADGPRLIGAPYGHDGFLIETGQVGGLIRELLGPSST